MTTITKNTNPSVSKNDALASVKTAFVETVVELRDRRQEWQDAEFKTANDSLYKMLAEIFETYQLMSDSTKESKEKRLLLRSMCEQHNYPLTRNASIVDMLVKFVFKYSDDNKRRLSTYIRCLKACVADSSVMCAADVTEYITDKGGVEEIIRSMSKSTTSSISDKRKFAKENFHNESTQAVVRFKDVSDNAAELNGSYVVLVGQVTASGEVIVKHMCADKPFADRKKSFGASAVNSALANMGAVVGATIAINEEQTESEQVAQDVNALIAELAA